MSNFGSPLRAQQYELSESLIRALCYMGCISYYFKSAIRMLISAKRIWFYIKFKQHIYHSKILISIRYWYLDILVCNPQPLIFVEKFLFPIWKQPYSLNRMPVFTTQTNRSCWLKTVKYFCKGKQFFFKTFIHIRKFLLCH